MGDCELAGLGGRIGLEMGDGYEKGVKMVHNDLYTVIESISRCFILDEILCPITMVKNSKVVESLML